MNQIGVIEFECDGRLFKFTIENEPDCDKIQTNYNHVISLNSKESRHNPDSGPEKMMTKNYSS